MAIKPMLFNTEMVQAILEGRKTVTRRVVKPNFRPGETGWQVITEKHSGEYVRIEYLDEWENETRYMIDPFRTGDILYVRETWARSMAGTYLYKATDTPIILDRWRPSIHMPREAARIFLRVTNLQVERLQDINGLHAKEEGCEGYVHINPLYGCPETVHNFKGLWDSTIKPMDLPTYGWEANPWVWVIKFERCERPEGWPC